MRTRNRFMEIKISVYCVPESFFLAPQSFFLWYLTFFLVVKETIFHKEIRIPLRPVVGYNKKKFKIEMEILYSFAAQE